MAGNAESGEGTKKDQKFFCTQIVFNHILKSLQPSLLWKSGKLKKRQVKYNLGKLLDAGFIRKIGYGTWEATTSELTREMFERRYKKVHRVTPQEGTFLNGEGTKLKPDTDRMHGAQVTVQIPRLKNWNRRAEILTSRGIKFKPIVQGQRIDFQGMKVWLCNTSIVMYLPYSWFADTSAAALEKATGDTIVLIRSLEKYLGAASFKVKGSYRFRFSKQEHALIKNALAQQYNEKKLKLRVFDDSGLWLLVDDSFNMEELEAVHPQTSPDDHRKVQNFFNSLKRNPIVTEQVTGTIDALDRLNPAIEALTQQIKLHLAATQEWKNSAQNINNSLGDIKTLAQRERPKMANSGASDERLEEISDMLSVLVQEKVAHLDDIDDPGIKKFIDGEWTVEVEITQNLPRFLIPHRGAIRAIGPFREGSKIYLDNSVATMLVNNHKARLTGENIA